MYYLIVSGTYPVFENLLHKRRLKESCARKLFGSSHCEKIKIEIEKVVVVVSLTSLNVGKSYVVRIQS